MSTEPLDANEGAKGDELLEIEIPDAMFNEYEWVEEGKPYREAMIPASHLNAFPVRRGFWTPLGGDVAGIGLTGLVCF